MKWRLWGTQCEGETAINLREAGPTINEGIAECNAIIRRSSAGLDGRGSKVHTQPINLILPDKALSASITLQLLQSALLHFMSGIYNLTDTHIFSGRWREIPKDVNHKSKCNETIQTVKLWHNCYMALSRTWQNSYKIERFLFKLWSDITK